MTIEVALLISVISVAFALYSGAVNIKRNNRKDTETETTQLTTMIVKLESIDKGVEEIKTDIRGIKTDMKDMQERLVKVEESTKQAHKRIDTLEPIIRKGEE